MSPCEGELEEKQQRNSAGHVEESWVTTRVGPPCSPLPSNRANWKLGAGYWTEPEQSHFLCHVSMHLPTAWPNCHRSDTTGACYLEMDSTLHYISNTAKCNWVSCMYPGHVLVSLYFSYSKHGRQELRRNRHLPVFDFVCFLHCIYVHPDLVFHMWWKTACYRLYIWKNHTSPEFVFL